MKLKKKYNEIDIKTFRFNFLFSLVLKLNRIRVTPTWSNWLGQFKNNLVNREKKSRKKFEKKNVKTGREKTS